MGDHAANAATDARGRVEAATLGNTANESRFGLVQPPRGAPSRAPHGPGCGRAHARHEVRLRIEVTLVGHHGEAVVENIGFGGARLALDGGAPAEFGDALSVSLLAPSLWDALVLRSRVVWVDDRAVDGAARAVRHVGVAFVHETPRDVLALHDLISALAYE
jgi:hypothetical protein